MWQCSGQKLKMVKQERHNSVSLGLYATSDHFGNALCSREAWLHIVLTDTNCQGFGLSSSHCYIDLREWPSVTSGDEPFHDNREVFTVQRHFERNLDNSMLVPAVR